MLTCNERELTHVGVQGDLGIFVSLYGIDQILMVEEQFSSRKGVMKMLILKVQVLKEKKP